MLNKRYNTFLHFNTTIMKHLKFLSLCGIAALAVSLFTLTACGGDDNDSPQPNGQGQTNNGGQSNNGGQPNNGGQIPSNWAELIVGSWNTVYANVSYVDEVGTQLSHNGPVDPTKEEDWPFYNVFVFGDDASFIGWAINYNGDGEYYGRFEETQIGKYSFNPANSTAKLYDLIMGYHDVQAYLNGQTDVPRKEMIINVQSLTEDELVFSINGMGTYKMKKEEAQESTITEPTINYAYLEGVWALFHKKGKDDEHNYDKYFPGPSFDGYEELVFGPSNTVEHWAQKDGQWGCDLSGTFTRNEDVITLNGMTIKILMLNEHELMIDMGSEIITAMKLPASAYPAPGVSISPEVLIGKWVLTHSVGSKKKDKETVSTWDKTNFSWESSLLLTINSNGTFEEEDKKGDNINWRPSGKGFWDISENKITISATGYYSISGDNNIYHEFSTPEIRVFIITRLTSTEIDFREYMFEDGFEYEETSTFTRVN